MASHKWLLLNIVVITVIVGTIAGAIIAQAGGSNLSIFKRGADTSPAKIYPSPKAFITQLAEENKIQSASSSIDIRTLIQKLLDLKDVDETKLIQKSKLITDIDSLIEALQDEKSINLWSSITSCIANRCPTTITDNYIYTLAEHLALISSQTQENTKDSAIIFYFEIEKLWSTNRIVEFSELVSLENELIIEINDPAITDNWNNLIECDNTCEDKEPLKTNFVRSLAA